MSKKILVSGSLSGDLNLVYTQILKLKSKGQNFDFLILLGTTFSLTKSITDYIENKKEIPIQTYFIDNSEISIVLNQIYPEGTEICKNLVFLGRAGIVQIQAFINGVQNTNYEDFYNQDVNFSGIYHKKADLFKIQTDFQQNNLQYVDILISNEWPSDILKNIQFDKKVESYSKNVSLIANLINPRYHFVPNETFFYQRQPYVNKAQILTRFLAIASFPSETNPHQEKYLYAFQIQPQSQEVLDQLKSQVSDGTENPYEAKTQAQDKLAKQGQQEVDQNTMLFFSGFDFYSREDEIHEFLQRIGNQTMKLLEIFYQDRSKRHKGCGIVQYKDPKITQQVLHQSGSFSFQGKRIYFKIHVTAEPSANCWFCMENPQFDHSLVFCKLENFYLALDKGPIFQYHFQIVPVKHYGSLASMPLLVFDQAQQLKQMCQDNFMKNYQQSLIIYERVFKINQSFHHTNVQCIPVHQSKIKYFQDNFENIVRKNKIQFFQLNKEDKVQTFLNENSQYFLLEIFLDNILTRYLFIQNNNQETLSMDFGRQIICELFGQPNKVNWKQCMIKQDQIQEQIKELKKIF